MKIIKTILAFGILICLFLPLSQCAGISESHSEIIDEADQPSVELKDQQDNSADIYVVISGIDDVLDINKLPVFIGFLLPLLFCVSLARKKWRAAALVLQTLNQFWLIYVTCGLVWFLSEPLWGGYLLTFCVVIYSLITIVEWIDLFRRKQSA